MEISAAKPAAKHRLADHPRISLGHLPTPFEPLERLSLELGGPQLWIKRDDCTGLGLGGNKVRKLEFLMGEALAAGADTILTTGGVQSNHARQTAAAAARLGLGCELVLPRVVRARDRRNYEENGNVLLDRFFGAEVFLVDDVAQAAETIVARLEAGKARGENVFAIPPGGSTVVGSLGYVSAAHELMDQADAAGIAIDQIFVATSTGGTLAGLVAGLAALERSVRVVGVCVAEDAAATRSAVEFLLGGLASELATPAMAKAPFDLDDAHRAEGYGLPGDATWQAALRCARSEGILLDPVYTGKAMSALLSAAKRGELRPGQSVVFWHTGGAPALFAYGDEWRGGVG